FFFSSRRRHTRSKRDWSSDVCSSDRYRVGADPIPLFEDAWERTKDDWGVDPRRRRQLQLAASMGAIPADYFHYYYFREEVLAERSEARRVGKGGTCGWW